MAIADILGSLASAGISYFNAESNRNEQRQYNEQQQRNFETNIALQKEFAQHGISWKVSDAVSAGLHPLIGAGSQAQSFSPVSVGGSAPTRDLGSMGQDIGRAIAAAKDLDDRTAQAQADVALEKGKLENDLLRTQLASSKMRLLGQAGPPMAAARENQIISGQGNSRVPVPRPGPARTLDGHVISEEKIKQAPSDAPAIARFRPFGVPVDTNEYFADAQKVEDRYGNIAEEIGGLAALAGDLYRSDPVGRWFSRMNAKPYFWQGRGWRNPFRNPN